ncbi:Varicose-related protein [Gracilariopsis chorda]|uniref:Varicose-related protein n=1 Tax=Gracilariopsis chorda TaxID=448386 RepID=A0A2V3IYP5_9FLOR|nr:Varicose-related protein [Gracilariopsis chorda]|eukprot:PXF47183.1 Varicose-related protein [Gracilariopsis chorda]
MVGTKPSAYLTEEARLEAQRRMLAERYGLFSDESDDGDDSARPEPNASPPPNGSAAQNGDTHQAPSSTANGRDATLPTPPHHEPTSSEAATYGENSSIQDSDLTFVMSQDDSIQDAASATANNDPENPTPLSDRASRWPGVELLDPHHSNMIRAFYQYKVEANRDAASARDLRVTQITMYPSQFLERHERKIAVNDRVITYAVGGHIRAILRNSPDSRCLLKGHDSSVADLEFLAAQETNVSVNLESEFISILGSVADDGSVYVWKIIRRDSTNSSQLQVQDAIRFEHPQHEKGKSYRRVAFRPGPNSIIAENGIGVAMLLMDGESPDLRVVELVKMNEKMMVRDKFLKARNEVVDKNGKVEGNIDSAAWLSEKIVVTSIHAFKNNGLLLVVEAGRELEYWAVTNIPPDLRSISVQLRQRIQLFSQDTSDLFCVTSVDPAEEVVIVSNVKGKSFFVLHYNRTAKAFDTVTEVPVRQPILSCSMTRNDRPQLPGALNSFPEMTPPAQSDDLGVWCVQPRGINLIHLPSADCVPRTRVQPDVFPTSAEKTISRKIEKIPQPLVSQSLPPNPINSASKGKEGVSGTSPSTSAPKRVPRSFNNVKSLNTSPSTNKQSRELLTTAGKLASQHVPMSTTTTPGMENKSSPISSTPSAVGSQAANVNTKSSSHPNASPSATTEAPASTDDVIETLLNAAKKAITAFEESAPQRSANEKVKMERLIESVTETAEANLERFVNSSMKKVLADKLVPGVSQIIAESREAIKRRAKQESKITTEHFTKVIERADISGSFSTACDEMTRQVSDAVTKSMSSKYEELIKPTVEVVNDAAEDLSASVALLRKEMVKVNPETEVGPKVVEIRPEDTRRTIEERIAVGNIDDAFMTALDSADLDLVMWLCRKFDTSTFFETHTLSQVSLLSLAQQLGQGLCDEDVELKVEWLREIMLVLEPDSEEIESSSMQTIEELTSNVTELRQKRELLDQYDGLEKKLKTLGRLITSHVNN